MQNAMRLPGHAKRTLPPTRRIKQRAEDPGGNRQHLGDFGVRKLFHVT
jgi:hypothetical protein